MSPHPAFEPPWPYIRMLVLRRLDSYYPRWYSFRTHQNHMAAEGLASEGLVESRSSQGSRLVEYRLILPEEEAILRALVRMGEG